MRTLNVFNNVSLDGYFTDSHGDMSWAQRTDVEWLEFTGANASGDSVMLLGRITYDLMNSFWPTPAAAQMMPEVATRMNSAQKIVFSRTMTEAMWENTTLVNTDIIEAVRKMKAQSGPDLVLMGSGQIIAQLAAARLIDHYQLVTVPTVLGAGRTMFEGLPGRMDLALSRSQRFGNGNVVSWYDLKG